MISLFLGGIVLWVFLGAVYQIIVNPDLKMLRDLFLFRK